MKTTKLLLLVALSLMIGACATTVNSSISANAKVISITQNIDNNKAVLAKGIKDTLTKVKVQTPETTLALSLADALVKISGTPKAGTELDVDKLLATNKAEQAKFDKLTKTTQALVKELVVAKSTASKLELQVQELAKEREAEKAKAFWAKLVAIVIGVLFVVGLVVASINPITGPLVASGAKTTISILPTLFGSILTGFAAAFGWITGVVTKGLGYVINALLKSFPSISTYINSHIIIPVEGDIKLATKFVTDAIHKAHLQQNITTEVKTVENVVTPVITDIEKVVEPEVKVVENVVTPVITKVEHVVAPEIKTVEAVAETVKSDVVTYTTDHHI
jgi:hypothetical protein